MNILNRLHSYARNHGQDIAIRSGDSFFTYAQLDDLSGRLANYIEERCGGNKAPVVVYGHKGIYMILCFLASVKSGRAYCPLDISIPDTRVEDTISAARPSVIFALEEMTADVKGAISLEETKEIIEKTKEPIDESHYVSGDDVFYIIFTSGSTGTPKGVQITADNLNHYLEWSVGLGTRPEDKLGKVFLNQAPFSFDLSVMDVYTCLASRGTLYLLDKEVQLDFKRLIPALQESGAAVWVSTPSFADMCMADKSFSAELMPKLETFLFCGETLTNTTALKLMERFPDAVIMNTYGPTESTVAVTEIQVTKELAETVQPLPVGVPKPGTFFEIHQEDGSLAPAGESGEIIIVGDTVSAGYFGREDLTRKAFFDCMKDGRNHRAYRTGDKGYLDDEGNLHYQGRIDLQIKLNGYRIEIEDIEKNIVRLEEISHAVVVPNIKEGKVKSLTAFVTGCTKPESGFKFSKEMKERLRAFLPAYMIPKKIVHMENLPMNNNGKVDRKQLGGLA
ncbi:D-alanine--poly(phosphoribitol) ligase subunit DltA [Anaerovorax odorimutans]|uniref:D-alanine--D-alanyl carrier protein ligase n=1 Tax=Anaerovorax odorimutans TaxID=109327 RepID=A0ABT1RQ68_9FIRM|nr:D-alanine--poly(phosphoribitol) ligase subunit DltA [Anaerovorax odorimutans]MCQ4637339.1 D-alanine--poly(phosphoribitol) ligase subunit DltA [Anaerovorax odorimutans]